MEHEEVHDEVAPPSSSTQPITRYQRMRQAEANVLGWVAGLRGGFDAGSGAMFDGRLDGLEIEWHEQDTVEHNAYLS